MMVRRTDDGRERKVVPIDRRGALKTMATLGLARWANCDTCDARNRYYCTREAMPPIALRWGSIELQRKDELVSSLIYHGCLNFLEYL